MTDQKPSAGMAVVLLIVASVAAMILAILSTSEATSGPVAIGIAMLFAIFARISQAGAHQREAWSWRQIDQHGGLVKMCPSCSSSVPPSTSTCPACGHVLEAA